MCEMLINCLLLVFNSLAIFEERMLVRQKYLVVQFSFPDMLVLTFCLHFFFSFKSPFLQFFPLASVET